MALSMTENHTELTFRYMRIQGRRENLLDFLLRKFRYLDREEWLENIREKRLMVDGRSANPAELLKDHQKILYLITIYGYFPYRAFSGIHLFGSGNYTHQQPRTDWNQAYGFHPRQLIHH